ncbi:ISAzo13 family transposase [Streptomyces sp. NBC_00154]|uniref:ISAzo13 family transposase n=1 Tax=Streptomyces sp. NBC_00154 TaxID=2975670 RepID=UPI00225B9E52|nr:ISAzo13 family transposase [Streptomyces sp. NBC_00154]MCX5313339.1 ISAzo13 family transposase [Streptomyces sp. NBC_00154]MCX5317335.1 ISAzo13 family transposase [Streptomyces sp. NBC_00154]
MTIPGEVLAGLDMKFAVILPHLDERQRRLYLASEAEALGHGGIAAVARIAEVSESTVARGREELAAGAAPLGRVRRTGGGRKSAAERDPCLVAALESLIEPRELGDPVSPLRWTTASLRDLSRELAEAGHPASAPVVGGLLRAMGFSLQGMAKTRSGSQVPDRDAQFRHINSAAERFLAGGLPVVSVDTKQKEPIGELARPGRTYRPKGRPITAPDHDFIGPDTPVAIPYGIYDLGRDSGWVNVGTDRNTAAFAVESLRRWWKLQGHLDYPGVDRLLVTADAGGANSADSRLFKMGLAGFADECGLSITVAHFPPGTSKWNKVEHRLFSRITHSLRGQPLTSYEVLLQTISATRTSTGLTVQAMLDENAYPTGRVLTRAERKGVDRRVERDAFHGEWNYTIAPQNPDQQLPEDPHDEPGPPVPPEATFLLTHPALTGMTREQFEQLVLQLEPCRQVLAEAERQSEGRDHRGRNPGFGILDHRHRVLAAVLRSRNTVTLTLAAELMGRTRNVLSYHAGRAKPLLAFAGPELARILVFHRTHPPRTLEALNRVTEQYDKEIKSGSR